MIVEFTIGPHAGADRPPHWHPLLQLTEPRSPPPHPAPAALIFRSPPGLSLHANSKNRRVCL